jgi:H+/gluconate symporter-like permease
MSGILAIVVALALLMYLAYRGLSLLILAPALAALVALVSVDTPLLASYTQVFMGSAGNFIVSFFPLFLLGAIFGKLMEDSGSAEVLAGAIVERLGESRAILAVVISCAVMTYGGVSLFVVAFAVFPIAAALFRKADLPKRLIPRHHRPGCLHLHHDGAARHTGDPECHPDALLRHLALRRPGARHHDRIDHAGPGSDLAHLPRQAGPSGGRGLRRA